MQFRPHGSSLRHPAGGCLRIDQQRCTGMHHPSDKLSCHRGSGFVVVVDLYKFAPARHRAAGRSRRSAATRSCRRVTGWCRSDDTEQGSSCHWLVQVQPELLEGSFGRWSNEGKGCDQVWQSNFGNRQLVFRRRRADQKPIVHESGMRFR
jgi:hypothetical protein